MVLAACTSTDGSSSGQSESSEAAAITTTIVEETPATTAGSPSGDVAGFPVEVRGAALESKPKRIVTLDASATEVLFAVGAGAQVIAADSESDHPVEAPTSDLDAASPSPEAILGLNPDLVIVTKDRDGVVDALRAAGVPVFLTEPPRTSLEALELFRDIGTVTGNRSGGFALASRIERRLEAAANLASTVDDPIRVYHELDDSFFSASSNSFTGSLYEELGVENIADEIDTDRFGLLKLSASHIFRSDPDLIVITDQIGYTVSDVSERPGWSRITAVETGNVIQVNAEVSSRWGPRMADFAAEIAEALANR